eukprot:gnl/Ergobibamus_cyprinoides/1421.p1 GENE.gnl/Ergobibamus_cyprinoides/1421~~gnl/Ergobibamus_cyprinoides/1421.p1  ORF type:complete len:105 (+),score=32.56 gnl/Ergobibamus_cyprinoides/1421:107-421(+)
MLLNLLDDPVCALSSILARSKACLATLEQRQRLTQDRLAVVEDACPSEDTIRDLRRDPRSSPVYLRAQLEDISSSLSICRSEISHAQKCISDLEDDACYDVDED